MKLGELIAFLITLPKELHEFEVVNGEVGILEGSGEDGNPDYVYRCDKPIVSIYVDKDSDEVCFFHQTEEEVKDIMNNNEDESAE